MTRSPVAKVSQRHVHLEPVGGIAGDMFVAAMLDLFPAIAPRCWQDLADSGVLQHATVTLQPGKSHGLAVKRLQVACRKQPAARTGHYRDLKKLLHDSLLCDAVKQRTQSIFALLASAEAAVHGVAVDDVHFHEVADWDSVVDIVAAASVIEHAEVSHWSCAALPLGSGLVDTEHGQLPVPAPATAWLLKNMPVWDDGEPGERVTPTGAAIVCHLLGEVESTRALRPAGVLASMGCGAGQRELQKRPNILRCLLIEVETQERSVGHVPALQPSVGQLLDQVTQLSFDIDDMTPEELALALEHIRCEPGVLDASFLPATGKKGRPMFAVRVLCTLSDEPSVSARCFEETTTLGMRVQFMQRRVLERTHHSDPAEPDDMRIKSAVRPSGAVTAKVESDDLAATPGLQARRQKARAAVDDFET